MSESGSILKASLPSNPFINNDSATTVSSHVIQPRRRMVQNYSIIWLEECMDQTNKDYENILTQLKTITDNVNVFKQRDECIDFLTDSQDFKSFLVVENTTAQKIMPLVNNIPQLDSVHVFSNIKPLHEKPIKKWQKIKSVHANIDDSYKALKSSIKKCNQDSIAMSFVTVNDIESADNLNRLDPTFMYTKIYKEILLHVEHGEQSIKKFIAYCRNNNSVSPINIDRFEKEYHDQLAIWWYTFPTNIFSMLNYALRTMDADIIITMGFFLRDLHQQIKHLYKQQLSSYDGKSFVVYRGQGLLKSDFEKLLKTEGGLMSFNNFLSTSTDKNVSLGFADDASTKPDTIGILFIMSIDPCIKSIPFASIKEESYFNEEDEILFSMHTVFRVVSIKQIGNKNQLYQVELQLTSDDDQQLRLLTDRIREEAIGSTGWHRLGRLLLRIGQFNKVEELYNVLLEQTSDEGEKVFYYSQLGFVHYNQGDYEKAVWCFEQGPKIRQKNLPSDHPDLATSYNNIGMVYNNMGEYKKALSSQEKALQIRRKALPSNHPDLAISYNNIGGIYYNMKDHSKALSYYKKALEIRRIALPSNHPDLTTSYNNIGMVYNNMGGYKNALSSHEKAREISEKTLPSSFQHLATSYYNIGLVYRNMKDYSKTLSYHERALDILQSILPPTHPHIKDVKESIETIKGNDKEQSINK